MRNPRIFVTFATRPRNPRNLRNVENNVTGWELMKFCENFANTEAALGIREILCKFNNDEVV